MEDKLKPFLKFDTFKTIYILSKPCCVWEEFKRNTTPINKELLDRYKNANDSVKHALNKEINFEYRKWVYNNKIKQ